MSTAARVAYGRGINGAEAIMQHRRHAATPIMISDLIAGVLVAESRCFRFVAVDRRFEMLDGSRFGHAESARQSAVRLARATAESRATTPCRILLA